MNKESAASFSQPNVARLYDYYLGGKDHYEVDRQAADAIIEVAPEIRIAARENRRFLGRAVRYLAGAGVRQFLDLGSGLPTQGNVHEVLADVAPGSRVAYVDNDPIVLAHSRALLPQGDKVTIVDGDLRAPAKILADPVVRGLLDFDQPLGVLLVAVLHFVQDAEDPAGLIATLREAMPPGSYLVLSHGSRDARAEAVQIGTRTYERATARLALRSRAEISMLFEGFELVDPGLVWSPEWRPDHDGPTLAPERSLILAGVGRRG